MAPFTSPSLCRRTRREASCSRDPAASPSRTRDKAKHIHIVSLAGYETNNELRRPLPSTDSLGIAARPPPPISVEPPPRSRMTHLRRRGQPASSQGAAPVPHLAPRASQHEPRDRSSPAPEAMPGRGVRRHGLYFDTAAAEHCCKIRVDRGRRSITVPPTKAALIDDALATPRSACRGVSAPPSAGWCTRPPWRTSCGRAVFERSGAPGHRRRQDVGRADATKVRETGAGSAAVVPGVVNSQNIGRCPAPAPGPPHRHRNRR